MIFNKSSRFSLVNVNYQLNIRNDRNCFSFTEVKESK